MAKLRFPLELSDGTQARSLDDLKEHFDLGSVINYYKNGKLLTWLRDRYIEEEANAIEALDGNDPDFQRRLCEIFGVEYSGENVDLEVLARRQERQARLREFTDEKEYLENVDSVVFDQEELADLLDEGFEKIYLCGGSFIIPASQKGKTYVGVNQPKVHISGNIADSEEKLDITISGCRVDNLPASSWDTSCCKESTNNLNAASDSIPESVADQIFQLVGFYNTFDYLIETKDYFLDQHLARPYPPDPNPSGLYIIDKRDGNKAILLSEAEYPQKYSRYFEKCSCIQNTVIAFFAKNTNGDADVYKINLSSQKIIPLNLKVDPYKFCGTNGRFFAVLDSYNNLICIDSEMRKKYQLQHSPYNTHKNILFTDTAMYFTAYNSDGDEVVEYTFGEKRERVIAKIPTCNCEAISYYDNKIFFCLETGSDYPMVDYNISYIDLASPRPCLYHSIKQGIHAYGNSLQKYIDGWAFVANKHNWELQYFDFKTMNVTTLAEECGYREWYKGGLFERSEWLYHANPFLRVGNWIYYRQGDHPTGSDPVEAKVSIDHPMSIELMGSSF